MNLVYLSSQPEILERICVNLTFEEAIQLQKALKISSLNCCIPIFDRDNQVLSLPRVDKQMIEIYQLITELGSNNALTWAVGQNNHQLVENLLAIGINPNVMSMGRSLIECASENNQLKIVQILLEAKADINKIGKFEKRALLSAAQSGHQEMVKLLLNHQADPNLEGYAGVTALSLAIYKNQLEVVREFLNRKVKISSTIAKRCLVEEWNEGYHQMKELLQEHGVLE